jgi:pyruvate/2-oxoglutarate dehydrogenase complex dihydrolipoamide acyltransferase (E2) component
MTRELSLQDASHETLPLPAPPLVRGEDAATYDQLAARIIAAVAPENVIEEIWVRDVVDLVWEVVRLRRLKAGLFRVGASDGMAAILRGIGEQYDVKAREWAARKPAAVAAVNAQLSAAGLDMDDVTTSTFAARLDQFERIERMLAAAEVRRAAALNGIDNRRVAERLRAAALAAEQAAAPPVEEGEFALVPDGGPA